MLPKTVKNPFQDGVHSSHQKPWLAIKSAEQYAISRESTILSTFVFCRIAVQIATRGFVVSMYGGQNCRFGTSNDLTLKKGSLFKCKSENWMESCLFGVFFKSVNTDIL
ncbi:hypothetical protein CEXT_384941 [Caerostris extrusa]|uniref:Uncharacterized protein n=1 Tax=Caerostris extrusa TaxID=172846 RepID=A0AAV4M4N3_CAEEX|nr:hypothetical protein CEXT_384941 [Caerostris extrusa]